MQLLYNKLCVSDLPYLSNLDAHPTPRDSGINAADAFVTPVKWTFSRTYNRNGSL